MIAVKVEGVAHIDWWIRNGLGVRLVQLQQLHHNMAKGEKLSYHGRIWEQHEPADRRWKPGKRMPFIIVGSWIK